MFATDILSILNNARLIFSHCWIVTTHFSYFYMQDSFFHNMNSVRLMFSKNEAAEVAAQR